MSGPEHPEGAVTPSPNLSGFVEPPAGGGTPLRTLFFDAPTTRFARRFPPCSFPGYKRTAKWRKGGAGKPDPLKEATGPGAGKG